jgi:hypothetical protein
MSRFVEIEKEINNLKPLANIEMGIVPAATRTGVESLKNQSINRIAELETEYKQLVEKNAVFVVLKGKPEYIGEFIQEAQVSFDALTVNASIWDIEVGNTWWEAQARKSGLIDTVHTIQLLDAIRKTMVDLKLEEVETPNVPRNIALNNVDDCIDTVKSVTTVQCGGKFRKALWLDEAYHVAMAAGWQGETNQPILFLVCDSTDEEANAVASVYEKTFIINVTAKTVTEKGVENALTTIAKKLKQ